MTADSRVSWRHPKVVFLLILIFLCGAAAGALTMRTGLQQILHRPIPPWQEGGREISMQKFKKELKLTPEQATQMESMLDDFVMYYQSLQSQMKSCRQDGKDKILRILSGEQKRKFDRMMSDLQAKLR